MLILGLYRTALSIVAVPMGFADVSSAYLIGAIGVAIIGITLGGYRRAERWSWWCLLVVGVIPLLGCTILHGVGSWALVGWVLLILAITIPAKAILGRKAEGVKGEKINIRNWLEKNKVFFGVLSPPLSIIAAILAILLAMQANKIALYQVKLMKLVQVPNLRFDVNFSGQSPKQTYTNEQVVISNAGVPLKGFQCQGMVFLRIAPDRGMMLEIVLTDYYETILTSRGTGELAILKNNRSLWRIKQAVDSAEEKYFSIAWWRIRRYVQVEYKDISEKPYDEIYFVSCDDWLLDRTSSDLLSHYVYYVKLSELQGKRIIEDYERTIREGPKLSVYELSPKSLYAEYKAEEAKRWITK